MRVGSTEARPTETARTEATSSGGGVLARQVGRLVSLATRARLTILIYHRVLAHVDPLSPSTPDVHAFETAMRLVRAQFHVLPLSEAIARLNRGDLRSGSAAITFDDGYADNATMALPILRRLGLCATFFVSTGFIGGGRMWNDTVIETFRTHRGDMLDLNDLNLGAYSTRTDADRLAGLIEVIGKLKYISRDERESIATQISSRIGSVLPADLMMTVDQVRELRDAGMTIGAHTVNHPILSKLSIDEATREIVEGKQALEGMIDQSVELFAYPNGRPGEDYTAEHVEIVRRSGFSAAVSTANGVVTANCDRFQLPRFTPWRPDAFGFKAQLLQNLCRIRPVVA